MLSAASAVVKNAFGRFIEAALVEPVLIKRSGRASVVMLSYAEFERLKGIEDEAWANKAKQALQEGVLTDEESKAWFNQMQERLNAAA